MSDLKVGIVTKEWPPNIYGGAGVHVLQLTQALRELKGIHVDVHCFGGPREMPMDIPLHPQFNDSNPAVQALATDLEINTPRKCRCGSLTYLVYKHGGTYCSVAVPNPLYCYRAFT